MRAFLKGYSPNHGVGHGDMTVNIDFYSYIVMYTWLSILSKIFFYYYYFFFIIIFLHLSKIIYDYLEL